MDWEGQLRSPLLWVGGEPAALRDAIAARVEIQRSQSGDTQQVASHPSTSGRSYPTVLVCRLEGFPRTTDPDPAAAAEACWEHEARALLAQSWDSVAPGGTLHWILPDPLRFREGHAFGPAEADWLRRILSRGTVKQARTRSTKETAARSTTGGEESPLGEDPSLPPIVAWQETQLPRLQARVFTFTRKASRSAAAAVHQIRVESPVRLSAVVLTCGDRPGLLREALDSIAEQLIEPEEILLIEDGGTDDVAALARAFGSRVLHLPRKSERRAGQAASMNRALDAVHGTHVAWLDDDDRWAPAKLLRQRERLEERPSLGVLGTRYVVQDADGRTQSMMPIPPLDRFSPFRLLLHGSLLTGPSAVVRMDLYAKAGRYDPKLMRLADHDFWLRAVGVAPLEVHPLPLTWVRRHPGNRRGPEVEARIAEAAAVVQQRLRATVPLDVLFPEIAAAASKDEASRARSRAFLERGGAALRAGLLAEAEEDFRAAEDLQPKGVEALLALGTLYLKDRRLDEAEGSFARAETRDSRDARPWLGLGLVAAFRQRWQEAEDRFSRALERDPMNPIARSNLVLHRFQVPGLASPLLVEVEALVRDLLLRFRPPDLALSLLELDDLALGRPLGF